jgi:precorrin isomerase
VVERRARDVAAAGRTMLLSAVIIAIGLGTPVVFREGRRSRDFVRSVPDGPHVRLHGRLGSSTTLTTQRIPRG